MSVRPSAAAATTHTAARTSKYAIVTGVGRGGISYYTTKGLLDAGYTIICAGRNPAKVTEAIDHLVAESSATDAKQRLIFQRMDVMDIGSIDDLADTYIAAGYPLDLIVNNAGSSWNPKHEDGTEGTVATNYLGGFHLVNRLIAVLMKSSDPRVINVSSVMHRYAAFAPLTDLHFHHFNQINSYPISKFYQVLHAKELVERYSSKGLNVYVVSPGGVRTTVWRHMLWPINHLWDAFMRVMFLTAEQGSATTLHAALRLPPNHKQQRFDYVSPYHTWPILPLEIQELVQPPIFLEPNIVEPSIMIKLMSSEKLWQYSEKLVEKRKTYQLEHKKAQ